jgi:hypothetical protein
MLQKPRTDQEQEHGDERSRQHPAARQDELVHVVQSGNEPDTSV